jgi:hypothetical protein
MTIDHAKAETILSRLLDAYLRKEYPFDQPEAKPPQISENLPKSLGWGTREHALFLFAVCYWMRGGIKSGTAIKALARLYDASPEIFLPESEPATTAAELTAKFRSVGLGFNSDEIGTAWKNNLRKIAARWDNDPRTIFSGVTTYEEACERIQNKGKRGFHGFQEKMVSMLTYFYMDAGIVDRWHFPIPVDFHVLRTVFAHEIVIADRSEFNGNGFYTKPILAAVRNLFQSYCVRNNVDPLLLCDAVWLYSGLMCNQHPGNQSEVGSRDGRQTELRPTARWSQAQTKTYERTCGVCVVQKSCKWCVPSAEYYVRGRIVLREERDTPPQQSFFPILI